MVPQAKPAAEYANFAALDIRVGTITQVLSFPRSPVEDGSVLF
ncbi:hypothetical protein [Novosphingobium sp. BW1]|nr:hypothetical protein [Novosphingobium sp. BW1]